MADYCKIEIDVRKHVKKYIVYHLGKHPLSYSLDQDIELNTQNFISGFIFTLLKKQYTFRKNKKPIIFNNKRLDEKIKISLPQRYYGSIDARYNFIGIAEKGEIKLDDFIDGLMKKEMFIMCESYRNNKRTVKEAINDFCELYSITDDDIQISSLTREYNRMLNQLNNKKI